MSLKCKHKDSLIEFEETTLDNNPIVRAVCRACKEAGEWVDYPHTARFSARLKAIDKLKIGKTPLPDFAKAFD